MPYKIMGQNDLQKYGNGIKIKNSMESALNKLETEGWRLVHTFANNQGLTKEGMFIFHKE